MNKTFNWDINKEKYDKESIIKAINKFNNRLNRYGVIYGQLGHPDSFENDLHKVSHSINWIKSIDNQNYQININLLDTKCGKIAKELIDNLILGFRASVIYKNNITYLKEVFTFDLILIQKDHL